MMREIEYERSQARFTKLGYQLNRSFDTKERLSGFDASASRCVQRSKPRAKSKNSGSTLNAALTKAGLARKT